VEVAHAKQVATKLPSEQNLASAGAFIEKIERQAADIEARVAPRADCLEALLAQRDASNVGDSSGAAPCALIQCQRCQMVMYRYVVQEHLLVCKQASPSPPTSGAAASVPSLLDSERSPSELAASKNGSSNCKGNKRKGSAPMLPPVKSRLSKSSTTREIGTGTTIAEFAFVNHPPLSPVLAAAATFKQERSLRNRKKRKLLTFIPDKELGEPLVLNASPQRDDVMKINRLARQNSESHLQVLISSRHDLKQQQQQQPTGQVIHRQVSMAQQRADQPMRRAQIQPQLDLQQQLQQQQLQQQQAHRAQLQQHLATFCPEQIQRVLAHYRSSGLGGQPVAGLFTGSFTGHVLPDLAQPAVQLQQHPTMLPVLQGRAFYRGGGGGPILKTATSTPGASQLLPATTMFIPAQHWQQQVYAPGVLQNVPIQLETRPATTLGPIPMGMQSSSRAPTMQENGNGIVPIVHPCMPSVPQPPHI